MPTVELSAQLTEQDRLAILEPLDQATRDSGFRWVPQPVILCLKDDDGRVQGGLIGDINLGWLRIEILSVAASLRGQGWGRRLVQEAERIATTAGCHSAWVDTFTFQTPGFYERLGYERFGELEDYPVGQTRIFYRKRLVSDGTPA